MQSGLVLHGWSYKGTSWRSSSTRCSMELLQAVERKVDLEQTLLCAQIWKQTPFLATFLLGGTEKRWRASLSWNPSTSWWLCHAHPQCRHHLWSYCWELGLPHQPSSMASTHWQRLCHWFPGGPPVWVVVSCTTPRGGRRVVGRWWRTTCATHNRSSRGTLHNDGRWATTGPPGQQTALLHHAGICSHVAYLSVCNGGTPVKQCGRQWGLARLDLEVVPDGGFVSKWIREENRHFPRALRGSEPEANFTFILRGTQFGRPKHAWSGSNGKWDAKTFRDGVGPESRRICDCKPEELPRRSLCSHL